MSSKLKASIRELVIINQRAVRSSARRHLHWSVDGFALLLHHIELVFQTYIYPLSYLIMNVIIYDINYTIVNNNGLFCYKN